MKKKGFRLRFRTLVLLLLLLLLLLFMDSPFGLGTGLIPLFNLESETDPVSSTTEAAVTTEGQVAVSKVTIRVSDLAVYVDDALMAIDAVETFILEADVDTIFVLKDDKANNTVYVAVEKMLVDAGRVYTVE